ncbi:MAG: universal stress protein [Armatimonadota bacterium]|nr:universal stress protein [Armatimonadota bacterium]
MKVVLGADGSEHAEFAADFLARYPMSPDSVVDCCGVYSASHVVTATSHPFLGPLLADQLSQAVDDAREGAEAAARRVATRLRSLGRSSEAHLLEGDPGDELSSYAEKTKAAFVVVGSRGLGRLDALLLGSVAREIANNRRVDLLVTRRRDFSGEGLRAVFATDHSDFAERVAAKLPFLMEGKLAELEVLSVVDPDSKDVAFARGAATWDDLQSGLSSWATERNEATVKMVADLADRCVATVKLGHARETILERAKERGADLIILGAQGQSALSRLLLGSVSNYVLTRAGTSVLIVRA